MNDEENYGYSEKFLDAVGYYCGSYKYDHSKALEIFLQSDDILSMGFRAHMLLKGWGGERNVEEALELYDELIPELVKIAHTEPYSNYLLARYYYDRDSSNIDSKYIVKLLEKSSDMGCSLAENLLGDIYKDGELTERCLEQAFKYYESAAMKNNCDALVSLALMYENGDFVEKSHKNSVKYLQIAADHDYDFAQSYLATKYYYGEGVEESDSKAAELFAKAAEKGFGQAQLYLGIMYEKGFGVERSYSFAFELYKKAADQNIADAIVKLGIFYYEGYGPERDIDIGIKYMKSGMDMGISKKISEVSYVGQNRTLTKEEYDDYHDDSDGELKYIFIKEGVETIDRKAFSFKDIRLVVCPQSLKNISDEAFLCCEKLETIILSDNLETIGNDTFYNTPSLKHIRLPDSLYRVGMNSFDQSGIEEIVMPSKITEIPKKCFNCATKLKSITFNGKISYIDSCAFFECKDLNEIISASDEIIVNDLAFANCKQLKKIPFRLKYAREYIEDTIFYGCGPIVFEKGIGVFEDHTFDNSVHPESDNSTDSSESMDADEQFNFGVQYCDGIDVPQSYEEAAKWYRKAAEKGHSEGQYRLGNMYYQGLGITQSFEEALRWYRKAAEQNHVVAQYNVGVFYERGYGVPQSYEEAVKWYRKAAEQGDTNAQYNLGVMYYQGSGIVQSLMNAEFWLKKAAEQGNTDAQDALGVVQNLIETNALSQQQSSVTSQKKGFFSRLFKK